MTMKDVRERVAHIREVSADYDIAHGEEDRLYFDVLTAIANGKCRLPATCATEALKTKEIKFARHTA